METDLFDDNNIEYMEYGFIDAHRTGHITTKTIYVIIYWG